ncbi:hypothetical protein ACVW16_004180 [Bradyrhizobium sp. USDA 4474]
MIFDRPFDRSSIGSNAHLIAYSIAPSIGFDRPFDRVCSIPPYPYGDRSRPPRPWRAADGFSALAWAMPRSASRDGGIFFLFSIGSSNRMGSHAYHVRARRNFPENDRRRS